MEPVDEGRIHTFDATVHSEPRVRAGSAASISREVGQLPAVRVSDQHGPTRTCFNISEPASFVTDVSGRLGPFVTTGLQEDYKARNNGIFDDDDTPGRQAWCSMSGLRTGLRP